MNETILELFNKAKDLHFDYMIKGVTVEKLDSLTSKIDNLLLDISSSIPLAPVVDKDLLGNLVTMNQSLKQDKFGLNEGYLIKDNYKLHYVKSRDKDNIPIISCKVEQL